MVGRAEIPVILLAQVNFWSVALVKYLPVVEIDHCTYRL